MTMSPCFDAKEWVAVLSMEHDPHSTTQLEALKKIKANDGVQVSAIDCSASSNYGVKLCRSLQNVPALCHLNKGRCVYGVHSTIESMEAACVHVQRESK